MHQIDEHILNATVWNQNRWRLLALMVVLPALFSPAILGMRGEFFSGAGFTVPISLVFMAILAGGLVGFAASPVAVNALARKNQPIGVGITMACFLLATSAAALNSGPTVTLVAALASLTIVPGTLYFLLPDNLRSSESRCPCCQQSIADDRLDRCLECGFAFPLQPEVDRP